MAIGQVNNGFNPIIANPYPTHLTCKRSVALRKDFGKTSNGFKARTFESRESTNYNSIYEAHPHKREFHVRVRHRHLSGICPIHIGCSILGSRPKN